jgi:hypothetical protein
MSDMPSTPDRKTAGDGARKNGVRDPGAVKAATDGAATWRSHAAVSDLVAGLSLALGDKLRSVVLYGPAARGEKPSGDAELHLLVVLADLELATLAAAGPHLARWLARGRAMPRLFTPATLSEAADVFPIELGDIAERHLVLHGRDPLASMPRLDAEPLRLQCERELREKMMRLQEAYALSRGKEAELARLLVSSYPAFALVFRGCLRLLGDEAPETSLAAAEAFSRHAGIDPAPFTEAEKLRHGEQVGSVADLFVRYYAALDRAVEAIDRFAPHPR